MVVHPSEPGQPNHGMPTRPKVDPSHRIDPTRSGDNHAVKPPTSRDGHPVTEKPLQNEHGRAIPPGRDHIGRIDRDDVRNNIRREHEHWNERDHDYHWHDWNGFRACHHYDEFGYHWWGFYVGSAYFWTRYYNDGYWWFDPYWHRWVFLRDGRWWWQNPNGGIYYYNGSDYYQYDTTDSGVVMTPDPEPPVDVPPSDPAEPAPTPVNQTQVYSLDGTRSIQITGDNRDAYLYDLTADPQSDAAQGRYIGTQVAGVNIDYAQSTADDGTVTQTVQQIELSYDASTSVSIVDLNGERRVDVSADAKNASLINLADTTVDPVALAAGVTATTLTYGADDNGAQTLQTVVLTVADDAGNQTTLTFDRNGASLDTPAEAPPADEQPADEPPADEQPAAQSRAFAPMTLPTASANAPQALQQKFQGSETFQSLKAGFGW